jgi:YD repeat-containing protein
MVKLTDADGPVTAYTYDAVRLTVISYPNGWYDWYAYDAHGQMLIQTANHPDTSVTSSPITHTNT